VKGLRFGPIKANMWDSGKTTRPVGKVSSIIPTETSLKGVGRMTNPMVKELTLIGKELRMLEDGKTTGNKGLGLRNGWMAKNMKDSSITE
jgi:hypothetical protein